MRSSIDTLILSTIVIGSVRNSVVWQPDASESCKPILNSFDSVLLGIKQAVV